MKKSVLLLALGILGAYQLGYSENTDMKVEKSRNVEVKQNEVQTKTKIQTEENSDDTNADKAKESKEADEVEKNSKEGAVQEVQSNKKEHKEKEHKEKEQKKAPKEPKVKKLTPEQERRLDARARKNKEKKMTLDEKLDFQILKMERMLKSLEGK